jgi:hypothetical protein
LSAQTGTESMIPKAKVCESIVSDRINHVGFWLNTYVVNVLERAEGSADRALEDTLQKTGLANEDVKEILVVDDKLHSVRTSYARRQIMEKGLTVAKASQIFCSAAASV